MTVQVPRVAARSQRSQPPAHAVSQQTPSAHEPEAHCEAAVHADPCASLGLHVPVATSQKSAAMHPASLAQLVGQVRAVPLHTKGLHAPPEPVSPAGAERQLPTQPGTSQRSQAPAAQAVVQQTPSAQKPEEHSSVRAQVAPLACLALHTLPVPQK